MKTVIFTLIMLLFVPCAALAGGKIVLPHEVIEKPQWTGDELKRDVAIKKLYEDESVSVLLMRMTVPERPHFHDYHTLTVTLVSGSMAVNYKDHKVSLAPGDVVNIPKGTFHWAQPEGEAAVEALVVFTPKFDGKDRRWAD